jgi:hypothetical protein
MRCKGPFTRKEEEMLPGVERAIMRLADAVPQLVIAISTLTKAVNLSIDNVNSDGSIKLDDSCTCMSKGWDFFEEGSTGRIVLQRCDSCAKYKSDRDAAVAIEPMLQAFAGRVIKEEQ